ncbi:hypothetical protein H0H87_011855, partial [Tephrocybe sp. NHM501043]
DMAKIIKEFRAIEAMRSSLTVSVKKYKKTQDSVYGRVPASWEVMDLVDVRDTPLLQHSNGETDP